MCDCANMANEKLKEYNTQLTPIFTLSGAKLGVIISTTKIDSKKRAGPIKLFASYCPFCGEEYPTETKEKK